MTSNPKHVLAQEEIDDARDARSRFTRSIFAWLDQVARDASLPSNAFVVGYAISQHINRHTGEAFPSTELIAKRSGLYPASVRSMIRALHDAGHLSVEWGKQGRGHPNRYRLIHHNDPSEKPQERAVLDNKPQERAVLDKPQEDAVLDDKPQDGAVLENAKPQISTVKPQERDAKTARTCGEPLNNYYHNHKESVRSTETLYEEEEDHRPVIVTTSGDDADDGDSAALAAVAQDDDPFDDDDDAEHDDQERVEAPTLAPPKPRILFPEIIDACALEREHRRLMALGLYEEDDLDDDAAVADGLAADLDAETLERIEKAFAEHPVTSDWSETLAAFAAAIRITDLEQVLDHIDNHVNNDTEMPLEKLLGQLLRLFDLPMPSDTCHT